MIKFRLKQEGPQIDDEKLIEEVSKHSFLYDTRSSDYRNLPLRASVWATIAKILDVEDQIIIQKRWKVLREKFSLSYRKQVLEEVPSNWILYESLTFLEPFVNLRHDRKPRYETISDKKNVVARSSLDEQVLIQLVKERPVLYDKKNEDFRVGSARRKAWQEISAVVNWDVGTLQKRWRVMRDRFVRELRKSKNADSDSQLSCSTFFREMLFLTHHVKSKSYEVEAHLDDSEGSKEYEYEESDAKEVDSKNEYGSGPFEIVTEQSFAHYIDDPDEMDSSLRYDDAILEEHVEVHDDEFIEEVVECSQNDEIEYLSQDQDELVRIEEVAKDQWPKRESQAPETVKIVEKRRISDEFQPSKSRRISESQHNVHNPTDTADNDEDLTFGNTLGCMLKRIPQHLKTAVKLKLLQSLAEFEAEHRI